MSPRRTPPPADLIRSTSPYNVQTRQASGSGTAKPKKREQFSACGACRMRRVRCDLKDLPGSSHTGVACSNCRERGLKCVDEFAEVKAVKLLRRGRRLQQAEAVYGKVPSELDSLRSVTPPPNVIPRLAPEFFDSVFFARFHVQRPILEPLEFRERYLQYTQGNSDALTVAGHLIAMTLVVWAASFGVNEYGVEDIAPHDISDVRSRKETINEMLQELLYLVDINGILRKASWDGARLLLLLLPLTQELQQPMDRLVMYEATLSQVYNLCSLEPMSTIKSGQGEFVDALVCARLFWYAYVTDGATSGLRGGRILLSDYDLTAFEAARLPAHDDGSRASEVYTFTFRCVSAPVRISSVCRTIHAALTGPMARVSDRVKEELLEKAWSGLDKCWTDLDSLRGEDAGEVLEQEDLDRFVDGWQIFIFECENFIREALQQKLVSPSSLSTGNTSDDLSHGRNHVARMHEQAKVRCHAVARKVVGVIKRNLGTAFFQYDASLVRDGCFFAAFLLAKESGTSEEVEACLQAMQEMRWVFSKSEERVETVKMIWQTRLQQMQSMGPVLPGTMSAPAGSVAGTGDSMTYDRRSLVRSVTIPPLTIPSGVSSSSSSGHSTSATGDRSWPPTTSSSRPPTGTTSLYNTSPVASRTSSYVNLPQLTGVMPHASGPKDHLLASSNVILGPPMSQSLSFDRGDDAYYQPFRYISPPGEGSSHSPLASMLLPPYHDVAYQDGVMQFGTAPLDPATEHMLSPVDGNEDNGVIHTANLY